MDPQIGKVTKGLRPLAFHSARFVVSTIQWSFRVTICNCHLSPSLQGSKHPTHSKVWAQALSRRWRNIASPTSNPDKIWICYFADFRIRAACGS